jgi:hypothetical protein
VAARAARRTKTSRTENRTARDLMLNICPSTGPSIGRPKEVRIRLHPPFTQENID